MCDKNASPKNNYKSPPPTNKKVRNPFDNALIERLHNPICSPGMCKIYKKKRSGSFRWDIDQASTLLPTEIVACNSQFEPSPDPALEKIAEEATERRQQQPRQQRWRLHASSVPGGEQVQRNPQQQKQIRLKQFRQRRHASTSSSGFFSQDMVMPSPLESSKKVKLQPSSEASIQITSYEKQMVVTKDVSAQTILTLPPELPPEIEKVLQPFCTFTQDQNIAGDYEITANALRRKLLFFEEHSDIDHYDSEQTDDEIHVEQRPHSSYEAHTPLIFSPDLGSHNLTKGMKRTFDTPSKKEPSVNSKPCYRNKILDVVDFGEPCLSPIEFHTPKRTGQESATSSSLASVSISPVTKTISSDEEKNNFQSPESDTMATCLGCITSPQPGCETKGPCFCKSPNKSLVKRSTSLKESPPRSRRGSFSFSQKRSSSLSNLHRSRSVQKLDFSMDMSIDSSFHNHSQADSESSPQDAGRESWSLVEESSAQCLVNVDTDKSEIQSSTKIHSVNLLHNTPIKGKSTSNVLSHEISKIRAPISCTMHMSLDSSLDNSENLLGMEDKKIDFSKVDLTFLTENVSQFDCTSNATKIGDNSASFKRIDSGFNENTSYASSYYESAIKPSELTVTNALVANTSKTALKEISNIPWMRVDSGFKDETSSDSVQFYTNDSMRKVTNLRFSEAKIEGKENLPTEDLGFFAQASKNDAMSMSDIFNEDMTFNCNFSSTPSKNKSRRINS